MQARQGGSILCVGCGKQIDQRMTEDNGQEAIEMETKMEQQQRQRINPAESFNCYLQLCVGVRVCACVLFAPAGGQSAHTNCKSLGLMSICAVFAQVFALFVAHQMEIWLFIQAQGKAAQQGGGA